MIKNIVIAVFGCVLLVSIFFCSLFLFSGCGKDGGAHPDPRVGFDVNINRSLLEVGSFTVINRIIVIRIADGKDPSSFVALSGICPDDACTVQYYDKVKESILCGCSTAQYNIDGTSATGSGYTLRKFSTYIVQDSLLRIDN